MTSSTLFLLILLICVANLWDILTSILTDGTFKLKIALDFFVFICEVSV